MKLTDIEHRLYVSLSNARESDAIPQLIKSYLDQGGSANLRVRETGALYSALGMCCHKNSHEAVCLLVNAGAKPHWPKKSLSTKYLTGSDEEEYEGLNADCLGISAEMLGGWIVENEESGAIVLEKFEGYVSIIKTLIEAGADPTRPDPAHGRLPLDSLMIQLIEEIDQLSEESGRMLENVIVEFARASKSLDVAAKGSWNRLPFSDLDWAEAYPSLAERVKARAQESVLQNNTQSTPGVSRRKRL